MDLYKYLVGDFPSKEERREFLKACYGPLSIALAINLEIHKSVSKIENNIQKSLDKFAEKHFDLLSKIL